MHEELRETIDLHIKEGTVIKNDRDMLSGILAMQDLEVADIMVHRTKMTMIDGAEDPKEIVAKVLKSGHTRIPVWKDTPDNIIGVLHAKNLFAALQKHNGDAAKIDIEDILLPPWFVPDTRAIPDQLNAFLKRKSHFAIVVDEYGEVQGLVTLEDIIEEIVGDIKDEHDAVATGVRPKPDGSYLVDGARADPRPQPRLRLDAARRRGQHHRRPRHPRGADDSRSGPGLHASMASASRS